MLPSVFNLFLYHPVWGGRAWVTGVALIESILRAVGMVLVEVSAPRLLAALVLIPAVIQLPPIIILGSIAAWVGDQVERE